MNIYDSIFEYLEDIVSKTYKRREIVYHEGDSPKYVYLIKSGMLGLFHVSETGKESFLRIFPEKGILGHRSSIAEELYHASSVALTPTELILIPIDKWSELLKIESINKLILQQLASDLAKAELRLAKLVDEPAKSRIAETLIYLKLKHASHIFTRKEIADYSGSTMETTARAMSELESNGLLIKEGRDYSLPNPESALAYFKD